MHEDRKKNITKTNGIVLVIFSIFYFLVWTYVLPEREPSYTGIYFKESIAIKGDEPFLHKLVTACTTYLTKYPLDCGLSGPNFGYWVKFYCYRDQDNNIVYALNPRLFSVNRYQGSVTQIEESLLCEQGDGVNTRDRFSLINVHFINYTDGEQVNIKLSGFQSYCFQHHDEILAGKNYPCKSTYATKHVKILKI